MASKNMLLLAQPQAYTSRIAAELRHSKVCADATC